MKKIILILTFALLINSSFALASGGKKNPPAAQEVQTTPTESTFSFFDYLSQLFV